MINNSLSIYKCISKVEVMMEQLIHMKRDHMDKLSPLLI